MGKKDPYKSFLDAKRIETQFPGIEPKEPHEILFSFQRDIAKWALRRGRACVFADCGMGKTFIQIEWARQIPGVLENDSCRIQVKDDLSAALIEEGNFKEVIMPMR